MKKKRHLAWIAAGVVLIVGLGYLALATRPSSRSQTYQVGKGFLEYFYKGPTVFVVSALDDPRTRIEPNENGFLFQCVMKTDHASVAAETAASPTGEVAVKIQVYEGPRFLGVLPGYGCGQPEVHPVK